MAGLVNSGRRRGKTNPNETQWRSLVRKSDFQKVYEQGVKMVGRLVVVYLLVPEGCPDLAQPDLAQPDMAQPDMAHAVVASKKVGNAVARNRAKRLMREARRLGVLADSEQVRRLCDRLPREPGDMIGRDTTVDNGLSGGKAAKETAAAADKNQMFAGLWVVLVARQRILDANSRQVRDELNALLGTEPQPL